MGLWRIVGRGLAAIVLLMTGWGAMADCSGRPGTLGRWQVKDGEVLDLETNLTWARCSVGMRWSAGQGCAGLVSRGTWEQANSGVWTGAWRVPNPDELATLLDRACGSPAINEEVFPKAAAWYWTSRKTDSSCWFVHFRFGEVQRGACDGLGAVRLVRDGQ